VIETQLTLDEVARVLRISYRRAAQLARDRVLPTVKLGRQVRVSPLALEQFVANGGCSLAGGWRREKAEVELDRAASER
jgi:excisionase family DNA binding protein